VDGVAPSVEASTKSAAARNLDRRNARSVVRTNNFIRDSP